MGPLGDHPHDVLHHDHRAIHDEAEIDRAEGHEVPGHPRRSHADKRGEHGERNHTRGNEACAQVAEHEEQHDDDKQRPLGQAS